jgi:hypothetical protein
MCDLPSNVNCTEGERRWRSVRHVVRRNDHGSIVQLKNEPMVWLIPFDVEPVRRAWLDGTQVSETKWCPRAAKVVVGIFIVYR